MERKALTIFVVEDDRGVASFLVDCFQEARGHKVITAGCIAESDAKASAPGFCPDVILHDHGLPDGSGPAAVRNLRKRFPNAKIVGTSAGESTVLPKRELEFLAAGADCFIPKPFMPLARLITIVETPRKEATR